MQAFDRGEWRMGSGEWAIANRSSSSAMRRALLVMALAFYALWLAACGAGLDGNRTGLSCIDDSAHCVGQRQAALAAMIADKKRTWVRETPTPEAHASGVRLFAFRRAKAELGCDELAHGRSEAAAAPKALRGRASLSPAQVSRATLLAAEVQRELAAEMRRRCGG